MHTFWELIASNALVVTALAAGVWLLGRVWKNPAGLRVLWLLVLLKLFTPPMVTIDLPLRVDGSTADPNHQGPDNVEAFPVVIEVPKEKSAAVRETVQQGHLSQDAVVQSSGPTPDRTTSAVEQEGSLAWPVIAGWIWGIGIAVVASGQAYRTARFRRLLRHGQDPPAAVCKMVEGIGKRLGLRRVPKVLMLPVRLPPLVWSLGGKPRVILPAGLFERLDANAREAILLHELVHVGRRDHLVRLLELAATTLFWWHPVVWWASGQLRKYEEQCCDASVLETARHGARTYAMALVDTLDFLSDRPVAAPLGATAARSAVSLARRIKMLKQSGPSRLTVRSGLLVMALAVVPMAAGFATAGPKEAAEPTATREAAEPGVAGPERPVSLKEAVAEFNENVAEYFAR
ncbi:MAG: M56 family metallopeptidase, partial [Planctomycetota bacterium]